MPKTKVYLSKSNSGCLVPIADIRRILRNMDIEIVEFTGGNYTHEKLLASDVLLVIPPLEKIVPEYSEQYFDIGKGQHGQIEAFAQLKGKGNVFIATNIGMDGDEKRQNIEVEEFYSVEVTAIDWQLHYAKLETDDAPIFITFYNQFKFSEEVPLNLDYDWEAAADSLKPKLPTPVSIKDTIGWKPSVRIGDVILLPKPVPMLACSKRRK